MDARKDIDAQVLVEDDDAKLRSLGITPVLDRSGFVAAAAAAGSGGCVTVLLLHVLQFAAAIFKH